MFRRSAPLDAPPRVGAALAVYAHPDDETFGLGAVLAALVDAGTAVEGLCFTRGEASTLGPTDLGDLGDVRAAELEGAAGVLGLQRYELLAYPDGWPASLSPSSPTMWSRPRAISAASCWWCSTTVG